MASSSTCLLQSISSHCSCFHNGNNLILAKVDPSAPLPCSVTIVGYPSSSYLLPTRTVSQWLVSENPTLRKSKLYVEPKLLLPPTHNVGSVTWSVSKVNSLFSSAHSQVQALLLPSSGGFPLCEAPHENSTPWKYYHVKCQEFRKFLGFGNLSALCIKRSMF